MQVTHVAFLTRELEAITNFLPEFCNPLPIEDCPSEGTREQYIEVAGEMAPSLLLMQPIADGPYLRAMKKRGPGLHHIGGIAQSISALLPDMEKHRLLLHPISLKTYPRKMIWLCRPEVPFLIELMESESSEDANATCDLRLPARWPIPEYVRGFFSNLVLQNSDDDYFHFGVGSRVVSFELGLD